jgi:diguanylate cyclase (GGDEF)-like protein
LSIFIALFALVQVSVYWCVISLCFTLLIFLAYRQYETDVNSRAREVASGSGRNDYSENYLEHLEQYISTLEKSIATLKDSAEENRRDRSFDVLTGLPNRKMIIETLDGSLESKPGLFAVLYLNLNRFRSVKEGLGHATGDRIIKQVAERIRSSVRTNDIAAHLGGDEFAVVLRDVTDPSDPIRVAEEISSRISEVVRFRKRTVHVTASIGIVLAGGEDKRAEDILRDAEIAMYNAKDAKKKWAFFDRTMFARTLERQQLETDLRYAIVCSELELFYQPIVRLSDSSLYGFEALVRWNHPRRGLMQPSEFIPAAEANGLIAPMSMQILRDACEQLAKWEDGFNGPSPIMSVNISAANLADPNFPGQIESILLDTGIRRDSLKLEITESAVMEDAETAIELLRQVKAAGVSVSIDDFGTGYSSLSYLQKFPLDYLKIDRSFISEMEKGGENEEIVRTIIALADALKLKVIAEGIETEHQSERLNSLGCEFGQGFLFSRPLSVQDAESFMRDGRDSFAAEPVSFDGSAIQLDSTH